VENGSQICGRALDDRRARRRDLGGRRALVVGGAHD
jgi:hypothetical protein